MRANWIEELDETFRRARGLFISPTWKSPASRRERTAGMPAFLLRNVEDFSKLFDHLRRRTAFF